MESGGQRQRPQDPLEAATDRDAIAKAWSKHLKNAPVGGGLAENRCWPLSRDHGIAGKYACPHVPN
jgi:hypothetical protein